MSGRRCHHNRRCPKAKGSFEQLLCVEFDVIFEVAADIDEGSITVSAIDIDDNDDDSVFR